MEKVFLKPMFRRTMAGTPCWDYLPASPMTQAIQTGRFCSETKHHFCSIMISGCFGKLKNVKCRIDLQGKCDKCLLKTVRVLHNESLFVGLLFRTAGQALFPDGFMRKRRILNVDF